MLFPDPLGPSSAVMVPSAAAKLTSSTALNVPKALLSPLNLNAACHYRASLELFRLNVSIPIRSTIENSASVRATTYPWASWYWSKARRM